MKKPTRLYTVVSILLLLLAGADAFASGELNASAGVRTAYHDNLFLENDDKDDDIVTRLRAQVGIEAKRRRVHLTADYSLNFPCSLIRKPCHQVIFQCFPPHMKRYLYQLFKRINYYFPDQRFLVSGHLDQ